MASVSERLRGRLGRITSGGAFIPEIDGLRFIAIAAVLFFHLNGYLLTKMPAARDVGFLSGWMMRIFNEGNFGVKIFFAISGFILALPFATHYLENGPRLSLGRYFMRRVTRLEPPYILNLLLVFILLVVVNRASASALLPHLGASLGYVHNLVYHDGSAINFVAWSLEVEVQFYLLAPALAGVFAIRRPLLRRGVIVAAMLGFIGVQRTGMLHDLTILRFIQYFLVGFLLVDIYLVDWKRQPVQNYGFDLIACGAWAAMVGVLVSRGPSQDWVLPWLVLIAFVGSFRGIFANRILRSPWIVVVGGMCYTFYLYHFLVISLVGRVSLPIAQGAPYWFYFGVQALIHFFIIFVTCSLLFVAFERPFMRRHWWRFSLGGKQPAKAIIPTAEA